MIKHAVFLFLSFFTNFIGAKSFISQGSNALESIRKASLWREGQPLKLHLGCGESYQKGYVNIDYPIAEHTIQTKEVADILADITTLSFPASTVDEIRSHHVFEHFNRGTSLGLLCSWHHALKVGGIVFIETPDFEQCIRLVLDNNYSYRQKQLIIRHIFGSHEAYWATHYDGWYKEKFKHVLESLGFEIISMVPSHWLVLHNITVKARKKEHLSLTELARRAKGLLRDSMVNTSREEEKIWSVWCKDLDDQIKKTILS